MSMLDSLLSFAELTNQLSKTERFISLPQSERLENVSEHCTQLALIAWFLIDKEKLPLDVQKVLQYSLIHDITEVNTGDFPTHLREFDRREKVRLEVESISSLWVRHPEASDLWKTYENYRRLDDEESKFVYSLDKLLPTLNIYLDSCNVWKKRNSSELEWYFEDLMQRMKPSPIILSLWRELYLRVGEEHPNLVRKQAS